MQERLVINIDPDGNVQLEVNGVVGPGCTKLTETITKALGETVRSVKTAEYHQVPQTAHKLTARGGF